MGRSGNEALDRAAARQRSRSEVLQAWLTANGYYPRISHLSGARAFVILLVVLLVAAAAVGAWSLTHRVGPARGLATTPTVAPTSTSAATPTDVAGSLAVPESTPVIPYIDTSAGPRVAAVAWTGGQPGLLAVPSPGATGAHAASPDGSRFLIGATVYDIGATVYDRQGTRVGDVPMSGKQGSGMLWADDSRHLCAMRYPGTANAATDGPTTLQLVEPGQPARDVAQVGRLQAQSSARWRPAACRPTWRW